MSKVLNILMLGSLVPWHPQVGGGYIIAYKLAEALAKAGHLVHYVAVAPKELQRQVEWGDILYISETMKLTLPFLQYFKTRKNLRRYDIVHVHAPAEGIGYGINRRLFRNTKLVIGVYAPKVHRFPLLRSLGEFFDFLACHTSDLILCLSEYSRENISDSYFIPKSKIKVMYGGVDESFFLTTEQYKEKSQNFSLLFCGRLNGPHEQKGVDILLKAMPLVLKEHDVDLNLIGSGPRESQYKELAKKLGIEHNVNFLSFIEHENLPSYYANADLFVLPSRRESFGLTIAEAMASGLPVVSTNVTAIPEVVKDGETGLLVPPNDPEKLAEAINSLLDQPEKMKMMGEKGRERAKQYFTWEKVAERVVNFYHEIL
jgi:glycosyltransferase involved in cell wall biosynthesis